MQTPKTVMFGGGYTYSAVPTQEENTWLTIERGSSWDNDAKTRVALCVAGLIVVAAACVAAAILWNHFYGAYKSPTNLFFAKSGIGILLGVAAIIGFALVAAGAIGTSKSAGTRRSAFSKKWKDTETEPLLCARKRNARRNGVSDIPTTDLAAARTSEIVSCKKHSAQWEDISETQLLLGTEDCNASRNAVSDVSTTDLATAEVSGIVPRDRHSVSNDANDAEVSHTSGVRLLAAGNSTNGAHLVSVPAPNVSITITGDVQNVVLKTSPLGKGEGNPCMLGHPVMTA